MSLQSAEKVLEGCVAINDGLVLYKKYKIITRIDNDRCDSETVKIISGGGSGHEPAHAGYVGQGMITTAVCGDLYASPSVSAIVNGILVTGDINSKIILIANNYTGDRINFGLALEIAKNKYQYSNIRMILVNDDISIDDNDVKVSVGRRGLAGIVLIHKIVGAMAVMKCDIDEIVDFTNDILATQKLCTIGFTFHSDTNLCDIEIGKGIHGEPGVYKIQQLPDFEPIIDFIVDKFKNKIPEKSDVVVLVNNLGGTSEFLFNIFNYQVLSRLEQYYTIKYKLANQFLTSLNSEGLSVTLFKVDNWEKTRSYLELETNVSSNVFGANKRAKPIKSETKDDIDYGQTTPPEQNPGLKIDERLASFLEKGIRAACVSLAENKSHLNRVDLEFGDGDTGTTLHTAATSILSAVAANELNFTHPKLLFQRLSDIMQESVGGTSGAIYSLYFQSFSSVFTKSNTQMGLTVWKNALKVGNDVVMRYALSKEGDRTMLDPLIAGQRALEKCDDKQSLLDILKIFVDAIHEVAEDTKTMMPKSGRAAYSVTSGIIK